MIEKLTIRIKDPGQEWVEIGDTWPSTGNMRLLAVTPTHPSYIIHPAANESIERAITAYDGPIEWLKSYHDNPFVSPYENVTYQHNKARQMALAGGYDGLLSFEADMIVPEDAIARLIECGSDIAYGLYVSRHKPFRWLAFTELNLWGGKSVSLDYTGKDARAAWGKIIDVAGIGMGCTLIKRSVLERIRFRIHDGSHSWIQEEYAEDFRRMGINPYGNHKNMVCDDYLLALDAQHYGFSQRCNMSLICGHIGDEGVYWPDLDEQTLYRIETE